MGIGFELLWLCDWLLLDELLLDELLLELELDCWELLELDDGMAGELLEL